MRSCCAPNRLFWPDSRRSGRAADFTAGGRRKPPAKAPATRDALHPGEKCGLDAYGWSDIPTDCEFLLDYEDEEDEDAPAGRTSKRQKKKPWRYRWPDDVRDDVLARLLELNKERAEAERLGGEGM